MQADKVSITCYECNADFVIVHSLNDSYYNIKCCPFCGADIDLCDIDEERSSDSFD